MIGLALNKENMRAKACALNFIEMKIKHGAQFFFGC
jgi:hypothetical protein